MYFQETAGKSRDVSFFRHNSGRDAKRDQPRNRDSFLPPILRFWPSRCILVIHCTGVPQLPRLLGLDVCKE